MHLTKMVMFSNERPNKSKTQKLYLPSVVCNKKEKSYEQEFSFGLRASQVSETRLWAQLHTFSATDTGIIYRKSMLGALRHKAPAAVLRQGLCVI